MSGSVQAADLGFFSALATAGSLSSAARELGITTPAVSKRLAQMESRLGVALVIRTTRRMSLTPEGEMYLETARRILNEIDGMSNGVVVIDRRTFVRLVPIGLAIKSLRANAQQAGKIYRIGYLAGGSPAGSLAFVEQFREGLREHVNLLELDLPVYGELGGQRARPITDALGRSLRY